MSTKVVYRQRYQETDEPVPGYRLTQFLGSGAMGEVWKANGPGGKTCALKIINLDQTGGRKEFRSLLRVKDINHPNLVPIHCIWLKDDQGTLLEDAAVAAGVTESLSADELARPPRARETMTIAKADTDPSESKLKGTMAWADDPPKLSESSGTYKPAQLLIAMGLGTATLYSRLQDCQERGEKGLPEKELLRYLTQAAEGLDFLNENCQIIHCDIKPQNILIVGNAAQVCDFGLARRMEDNRQTTAAFTPYYAPLEVIVDNKPGPATDQYSLAITYVELKTGKPPYESETQGHIIKEKLAGRLELRGLGPNEAEVIEKGAAVQPADRYSSCTEMVKALAEAIEADRQRLTPFRAILRWAAMLLVAVAIGGGAYAGWVHRDTIREWIGKKGEGGEGGKGNGNGNGNGNGENGGHKNRNLTPDQLDGEFDRLLAAREYSAAARLLPDFDKGSMRRASRAIAEQELATPWWKSLHGPFDPQQGRASLDRIQAFLAALHHGDQPALPEVTEAVAARQQWVEEWTAQTAQLDLSQLATRDELKARIAWLAILREDRARNEGVDPWDDDTNRAYRTLEQTARLTQARALARLESPTEEERGELADLLAAYADDPAFWPAQDQQRWRFCQLVAASRTPSGDKAQLAPALAELAKIVTAQKTTDTAGLDEVEAGRLEQLKTAWLAVLPDEPEAMLLADARIVWGDSIVVAKRLGRVQELIAKANYPQAQEQLTAIARDIPDRKVLLPYQIQIELAQRKLPAEFWGQFREVVVQPASRDALLKQLAEQAKVRPELAGPALEELRKIYTAADAKEKPHYKPTMTALLKRHLDGQWKELTDSPQQVEKSLELYRELADDSTSARLLAWLVELQLAEAKPDDPRAGDWKTTLKSARALAKQGSMGEADPAYVEFVAARVEGRDPANLRTIAAELSKRLTPLPVWMTKERGLAAADLLVEAALSVRLPQDDDLTADVVEASQTKDCLPWLELAEKLAPQTWKSQVAWTLVRIGDPQADLKLQFDSASAVLDAKQDAELKRLAANRQIHLARGRAALVRYAADRQPADFDLAIADHAAAIEGLFQFRSPKPQISDTALYTRILATIVPMLMKEEPSAAARPQGAHLVAMFGRIVDRSPEVREKVAANLKVPGTKAEQNVAALREAYRALERSTKWDKGIDGLVTRGRILLQLPDNDPLAANLQTTLEEIARDLVTLPDAAKNPGALLFQALLAQRQAMRTGDMEKRRGLLMTALTNCDDAEKAAGDLKDSLLARILEERSNLHLNAAFLTTTPTFAEADPDNPKANSRGWHLRRAARDAAAAIAIDARDDGENAHNALGNATEDQALYLRWEVKQSYPAALEAFDNAYTAAAVAGDAREAFCLLNMGRCRLRYAEDPFVALPRTAKEPQFVTAAQNLVDAIDLWNAYDSRKSEAYYWLSRAYARLATLGHKDKVPMPGGAELDAGAAAAECAVQACKLAESSGQPEWALFALHQAELAQLQGNHGLAQQTALQVMHAFRDGGLKGRGGVIPVTADQAYRASFRRIEAASGGVAKIAAIDEAKTYFPDADPGRIYFRAKLLVLRITIAVAVDPRNLLWKRGENRWVGADDALKELKALAARLADVDRKALQIEIDIVEGQWQRYRMLDQTLAKKDRDAAGIAGFKLLWDSLAKQEQKLDAREWEELSKVAQAKDLSEIPAIRDGWSDYLEQRLMAHLAESQTCRDTLAGTIQLLLRTKVDPQRDVEFRKAAVHALQPLLARRDIPDETYKNLQKFLEEVKAGLPPAPAAAPPPG